MNARKRYAAISFLTGLPVGLFLPAMVLLMLDRGLSLPTIAAISTAYSVCVAVLELPTGGLADAIGRRPVLIAAAFTNLVSLLFAAFATTAWLFAVAALLRGVGRALGSGPAEAWYVDTVHATEGPDAELGPGLARGSMAGSIGLTLGTLAGGLLPIALVGKVAVPLTIPLLLAAGVEGARLILTAVALPEPRHAKRPSVMQALPKIGGIDHLIARLLLIWGAVGVALATVELLTPAWFADVTGTFEKATIAYAIVAALGFAADSVGSALSMLTARLTGTPARASMAGLLVMGLALLGLAASVFLEGLPAVICAGLAYFAIFVGLGAASPQLSTLLHQRTEARQRATFLSMQSLSLQICGALGALAFAWVTVRTGPALAFGLAAAVIAGAALLMRARQTTRVPQKVRDALPQQGHPGTAP